MQIEHVGFYETRDGRLRYALAKLPECMREKYQWVACDPDGLYDNYTEAGCFDVDKKSKYDLIRYLPTVKSWNDPIPPAEPPAVTVYTEWLSVGEYGNRWTGWTKDGEKPCFAVAKLRTIEVPANENE